MERWDPETGEMIDVEEDVKPALWVKVAKQLPPSVAKHVAKQPSAQVAKQTPEVAKQVAKHTPVVAKQVAKQHIEVAKQVAKQSCNPHWSVKNAQIYGQLGGLARRAKLTPERRREISKMGTEKRWG